MCFDLCSGELLTVSEQELKLVGGVHASSLSLVIQSLRLPDAYIQNVGGAQKPKRLCVCAHSAATVLE